MKGANTEPWVKMTNAPIKTIVIINGASQYFFRILKKSQISFTSSKKVSTIKRFCLGLFYNSTYSLYMTFSLLA